MNEGDIRQRVRQVTSKCFYPPAEVKEIAKSICMVDLGYTKYKVRETHAVGDNWPEKSFWESLDVHKLLQEKVPGVPKIIRFIDEGDWKYKFVEWMEGKDFIQLSEQYGSRKAVPVEYFYQFGQFMLKVKAFGWYGQDGYWGNPFYLSDRKTVVVCDYGIWSFSPNQRYEELFIEQFF